MKIKFVVFLILLNVLCVEGCEAKDTLKSYAKISMVSLIADPESSDNRQVSVSGVISTTPSLSALYLSMDFFKIASKENRVIIQLKEIPKELCFVNGEFVTVHGKFKLLKGTDYEEQPTSISVLFDLYPK